MEPNVNGFLVPSGHPAAHADALGALVCDDSRRWSFGDWPASKSRKTADL